ncbi:MAG: restriction endonuclease [Caldilineaceae bacterium]
MNKTTIQNKPIIYANQLQLDEWLVIVMTPDDSRDFTLFPDYCFPSNEHRDAYLATIETRDPAQVKSLLRVFLTPTGFFGGDIERIESFIKRDCISALEIEQVRRVIRGDPAWEGLTWVLDLLHRPRMAIDVIHGYLAAHFWWMPDWRISGLFDAMTLIRAAYLEPIHPRDELLMLAPRDFELLIALLFKRKELEVYVTRKSRDGGYDIRVKNTIAGNAEVSVIECKRYTDNVGVKELRALLGVVERDRATRGLLVTTAGFTQTARYEASQTNRIELIDYNALCKLLNEHFGSEWLNRIDSIIVDAQRKFSDSLQG